MGVLQQTLEQIFEEYIESGSAVEQVVSLVLKRHDIELSDAQLRNFTQYLLNTGEGEFHYQVDSDEDVEISLSDKDFDHALAEYQTSIEAATGEAMQEILTIMPPEILSSLRKTFARELKRRHKYARGFERRLAKTWQDGIDRLEILLMLALEAGEEFNEAAQRDEISVNPAVVTAVMGLHVRACRTVGEILVLLKAGYADGANARWRALHEIVVVAMTISQNHGDHIDIGERYLDHSIVERRRAAKAYQRHHQALGFSEIEPREMAELEQDYQAVLQKYKNSFKTEYGWAAGVLSKERPTLADLEEHVDLAQWRPYYRMANYSVHAGAQSLAFNLGIPEAVRKGSHLAGTSDAGLCDPGHSCALSLVLATCALLTLGPDVDRLVTLKIMDVLAGEAGQGFFEAHEFIEAAAQVISRNTDVLQ